MRALVLLLAAGCFGQPVRDDCQVRCGEGAACPDDYLCGADLFCHPSDLDTPRDCAAAVDGGEAELVPCDTVEECGGGDAVCRCGLCAAPDASCTPSGLRFVTTSPVAGPCAAGATGVGAGSSHSCAVMSDGHAFCWGANCDGQLGTP
jgi:hypothetical protein